MKKLNHKNKWQGNVTIWTELCNGNSNRSIHIRPITVYDHVRWQRMGQIEKGHCFPAHFFKYLPKDSVVILWENGTSF